MPSLLPAPPVILCLSPGSRPRAGTARDKGRRSRCSRHPSLRLSLILPIIPLLHMFFLALACRAGAPSSTLSRDGEWRDCFTSRVQSTPSRCSLVVQREENLGEAPLSQVNGRGIGLPSGVRVIVTETTPDTGRKINETGTVCVKMHLPSERTKRTWYVLAGGEIALTAQGGGTGRGAVRRQMTERGEGGGAYDPREETKARQLMQIREE